MNIDTATQPQFFPPLYMFVRFAMCSCVVFMEEAQYSIKGGHSRLTYKDGVYIPISLLGRGRKPLNEIQVTQQSMWEFHKALYAKYSTYPYFENVHHFILSITNRDKVCLSDFNIDIIMRLCNILAINCTFFKSTDLVESRPDNPTEWLAQLSRSIDGTDYMQGRAGIESYFDMECFQNKKINVWAQETSCQEYDIRDSVLTFMYKYGVSKTQEIIKELAAQPPTLIGNFR